MIKFIKKFRKDEEGAVTVDWVVLTAAVVGLGVAGVSTVSTGVNGLATKIGTGVNADANVGAGTN
ncbi:Flp family type IVb pilin [Roseovarius sp.]|uniref:Flp family type IVb pilin n=1 Tax=Roseovarius sp. TaxID=1486281 RepID=UPI003D107939